MKAGRLLLALLAVVLVGAGAVAGLRAYVIARLSPEALRKEMEAEWNCRAHVGSSVVTLFARPSRVVLEDIRILPRGAAGEPPAPGPTGVVCRRAVLEADLWSLVAGEIRIRSIALEAPELHTIVRRDGSSSISEVFDEPAGAAAGATASASRTGRAPQAERFARILRPGESFTADAPGGSDAGGGKDAEGDEADPAAAGEGDALARFHADEIPLPATLDVLTVSEGTVVFAVEKAKGSVRLEEIAAELAEIDIDAAALDRHNSARLALRTRLAVDGRGGESRFADLRLSTEGAIVPFDPATGFLNPEMVYDLTLHQGSAIDSWPVIDQLAGSVKELKEAGVELKEILGRAELQRDASLKLRIFDGKIGLAEALNLGFAPYALTLDQGSWVRTADNAHGFEGTLTASEELTAKAVERMEEEVKDKAGDTLAEIARELLVEPLLRDGRIALDFRSSGSLSKPKVRIENPLKDLGDILEEAGKSLFKKGGAVDNLLKGLFGK